MNAAEDQRCPMSEGDGPARAALARALHAAGLPAEPRERCLAQASLHRLQVGEQMQWQAGELGLLRQGLVGIGVDAAQAADRPLALVGAGGWLLGALSAADPDRDRDPAMASTGDTAPREAQVALCSAQIWVIRLAPHHDAAWPAELARHLALERLWQLTMGRDASPPARLGWVLSGLAASARLAASVVDAERASGADSLALSIGQQTLAASCGLSRTTTWSLLQVLTRSGWMQTARGQLWLHRLSAWAALRLRLQQGQDGRTAVSTSQLLGMLDGA